MDGGVHELEIQSSVFGLLRDAFLASARVRDLLRLLALDRGDQIDRIFLSLSCSVTRLYGAEQTP